MTPAVTDTLITSKLKMKLFLRDLTNHELKANHDHEPSTAVAVLSDQDQHHCVFVYLQQNCPLKVNRQLELRRGVLG